MGNGKIFQNVLNGLKSSLGINDKFQETAGGLSGSGAGELGSMATESTEAIAAGGRRSTVINISLRNMIENVKFEGSASENVTEIERVFSETLARVLGMAETAA